MQALFSALDTLLKLKQAKCDHLVQDRSTDENNQPYCTNCGKKEYAQESCITGCDVEVHD